MTPANAATMPAPMAPTGLRRIAAAPVSVGFAPAEAPVGFAVAPEAGVAAAEVPKMA